MGETFLYYVLITQDKTRQDDPNEKVYFLYIGYRMGTKQT